MAVSFLSKLNLADPSSKLLEDLVSYKKHLWIIRMDEDFDEAAVGDCLSASELEKSRKFRFAKDRRRYIYFHSALRRILSEYGRKEAKDIEFAFNEFQKPFLAQVEFKELHFNFSHSEDLAVCVLISGNRIGVDVEQMQEQTNIDSIAKIFFSSKDKEKLSNICNAKEKEFSFYSLWTGIEAYGKAIGRGISFPVQMLDIPFYTPSIPAFARKDLDAPLPLADALNVFQFVKEQFKGLDEDVWNLDSFLASDGSALYLISCVTEEKSTSTLIFSYSSLHSKIRNCL